jgi:UDP-N-acetylglucosamine transferase subunit ALG13
VIFGSVGSMLPFERLVVAMDEWARDNPEQEVFIQIGDGRYEPQYARFTRILPMTEYRDRLHSCDLFVAHVGMGAILQGLEEGKQMLLMPRLHSLGEHTTDHQVQTACSFRKHSGIRIVEDADSLRVEMSRLVAQPLRVGERISNEASPELIAGVTRFLDGARSRH